MDPDVLRRQANGVMKNVSDVVASGMGTVQRAIGVGQSKSQPERIKVGA